MRVGLMTREYPPEVYGGAGVHVEYLSRELAKLIEVEVHCWGSQRGDEPPAGVTTGLDPNAKFKTAVDALALNLSQMKELAKIDVVHTHTWYASMAGFLAKKLYGVPFVLTTHSLEPLRAWKAEQLGSGYAMSSWMERTAVLDADAIIAVSHGTKADILRVYPEVDAAKVHVIYNGIDLQEYRKTKAIGALVKFGVDASEPYVLFVGRITRQKGVVHLVDAVKYLPKGTQVVLCAGAPDTPEMAAEMRAGIEEAQAAGGNIRWIEEMITKPEAIELYSNCRVFCCPSVYEPFGIINLEAMACGAPVVASAVGGILEVVVDGAAAGKEEPTGWLVPFEADAVTGFPVDGDRFARELARRIAELMGDVAMCARMGAAGRKRVEKMFAWEAIAKQTVELYRGLVG
jgi:starch synthase